MGSSDADPPLSHTPCPRRRLPLQRRRRRPRPSSLLDTCRDSLDLLGIIDRMAEGAEAHARHGRRDERADAVEHLDVRHLDRVRRVVALRLLVFR